MIKKLRNWARRLKNHLTALYYAQKQTATPWYCRVLILLTLLYALSPINLIPDFIPVLGLLDDLILLPLFIYLSIRLLPKKIREESLAEASRKPIRLPKAKAGILLFILFWAAVLLLLWHLYCT